MSVDWRHSPWSFLRLPLPPSTIVRRLLVAVTVAVIALGVTATTLHLATPAPSGVHAVGRQRAVWTDEARPEAHTASAADHRSVPVQVWYPAEPGTGTTGGYVPDLAAIARGLEEAGAVNRVESWGLRWVRHHARDHAAVAGGSPAYPVVLLSPGNQTNVAFYATLAEELASRGYVVIGVDHPYQVAAVQLPDGSVATYDTTGDAPGVVSAKIDERVGDLEFVLRQLRAEEATLLDGMLDLSRIAVVGHSNGGLAAVELCRRSSEVAACVNIDGQSAGGPFSTDVHGTAPEQPFLFLTKERQLHPEMGRRFEAAGEGAYRVVLPAASHDHFTDGALFRPTLSPTSRTVDRVAVTARGFVASFLDRHLSGSDGPPLGDVAATTDAFLNVYPLGSNPPIPSP